MPSPENTPLEIGTVRKELGVRRDPTEDGAALRINWGDGHESIYRPHGLRMSCPCAGCVDEFTGRRMLTSAMVRPDVYPTAIHYVGRYALQFVWSDGHDTGIYTYELLRGSCGCEVCSTADDTPDTRSDG